MKITIDTKEDSHEDIRKVMQILQHFAGSSSDVNGVKITAPVDTTNMMSMFGDGSSESASSEASSRFESSSTNSEVSSFLSNSLSETPQITQVPEQDVGSAPDFGSFLNLTKNNSEDRNDEPKVELF